MLRTAHYFTRQALREQRAARQALTDAARERHSTLAAHFASIAEGIRQSKTQPPAALE